MLCLLQQQKYIKRIATAIFGLALLMGMVAGVSVMTATVYAQDAQPQNNACPEGYSKNIPNLADDNPQNDEPCIPAKIKNAGDPAVQGTCKMECLFDKYINPFTKLLAGLVGLVSAISLVYSGIQFSSSAGDPGKVQEARNRIAKTVVGLLAFLFMFGFLQWLVPGGIF